MARRNEQAQALQPVAPLKPVEQRDFYNVPDSTASNLILETLGAGADVTILPFSAQTKQGREEIWDVIGQNIQQEDE